MPEITKDALQDLVRTAAYSPESNPADRRARVAAIVAQVTADRVTPAEREAARAAFREARETHTSMADQIESNKAILHFNPYNELALQRYAMFTRALPGYQRQMEIARDVNNAVKRAYRRQD